MKEVSNYYYFFINDEKETSNYQFRLSSIKYDVTVMY